MKTINLTHANHNIAVHVVLSGIMFYHQYKDGTTWVYTPAGVIPVKESVSEVKRLMSNQNQQGGTNVEVNTN